ncbi:uncharacterized protein LOC117341324 isoform X5 [Pecten maximus]|uniref:uncharacterized protein LOC117341324 isoform X5 n=1 Tax=Pecten maximus TaxID=6579 RepID=UPI0014588D73|nr:uncharacterized protein LOC117341324 isoform X5 [Pecten maximus]
MSIFPFSLAFCLLLVWVPTEVESLGTICQTAEVAKSYGPIKCLFTRLFKKDKSCKEKTTKLVCITLPTTTTLPTTATPNQTSTEPSTTTDPTSVMDCSVETFFRDSQDSTKYYQCLGNTPTLFRCPVLSVAGTDVIQAWDQYTHSCMIPPEADVTCEKPNGRQHHPSYCNMYIECHNSVLSKIRCRAGLGYDDSRKDCILDPTCIVT